MLKRVAISEVCLCLTESSEDQDQSCSAEAKDDVDVEGQLDANAGLEKKNSGVNDLIAAARIFEADRVIVIQRKQKCWRSKSLLLLLTDFSARKADT